ncbi:MAG: methyltransferase domain-containing protein [Anaerolineae bacterium]|nr:methyltransferase domain-containing protein [Anaerolineae bacterium]
MSDSLTLSDLDFLQSDIGQDLLAQLAQADLSDSNQLRLLTQLRQQVDGSQAAAALSMARLRQKAISKFGADAARMFFTPSALEQASDPLVRRYRTSQIQGKRVLDICCGMGTDTMAFADAGCTAHGLDIDPVRIAIAKHNAEALHSTATFEVADVTAGIPIGFDTIFFDPARRDEHGRRLFDVEQYVPPLSLVQSWDASRIMVKLSPGVDIEQVRGYGGKLTFVSVGGDLKEAILQPDQAQQNDEAVLLTESDTVTWLNNTLIPQPDVPLSEPANWLVEPDPAILRAGLVRHLADDLGGFMLDETIGYLTTTEHPQSLWVRSWAILDWMPFHLKKLRNYLREHNVGKVTVKKRGSPITPEQLMASLKLKKGDEERTLVLTRLRGEPIVMICESQPV